MEKANVWKIASLEWPPYASASMTNGGIAIERLKKILQAKGIDLKVDYFSWEAAQEIAKSHDYVGYYPAWPSEVYEGFVASPTIMNSHLAIMHSANSEQLYVNLEQLFTTYKVGVVSSFTYPAIIEKVINSYAKNIVRVNTDGELLTKMNNQQIDLAITDPDVLNFLAKKQGVNPPQILTQFTDFPLVVALRKQADNNEKIRLLNEVLNRDNDQDLRYQKPKELFMTHVNIPIAEPSLELLENVYNDLGIKLLIQPVPTKRGLLLLESGIVDADAARVLLNMSKYENVVTVKPSLAVINISLICQYNLECTPNVLSNRENSILTSSGYEGLLSQFNIQANLLTTEKISNIIDMLKSEKFDYVIYPTTKQSRAELSKEFKIAELRDVKVNHVINKKHTELLPQLEKALVQRLKTISLN
ncbi:substrate-binding periplasmic protein [Colwelliaceae bacterium 6441]